MRILKSFRGGARLFLVIVAAVTLAQSALSADTTVYAVTASQNFGTLDLTTGVFTQIPAAALNNYGLGEYAGGLYGAGNQCGCLYQINPATGAATNASSSFSQNASGFGSLNGFGSTTGGLYVMGAALGGLNSLYSINPSTGVATLIGSTGISAGGGTGYLSASSDSSQLYWEVQLNSTDTLYSVNTSTGATTLIGSVTPTPQSQTGNPFALVFSGGVLWANFSGSGFGTVSTLTGAQTFVSTGTVTAFVGLAPYSPTALTLIGSMPHLAAQDGWNTTFTFVNKSATSVAMQNSMFDFFGVPLTLPITEPQTGNTLTASTVSATLAPNASFIMEASGPSPTLSEGSAQLSAGGNVDGFAIFHFDPNNQEAVVPLETRNASSYLLPFDNTSTVVTGVAVANVSSASVMIPVIIRDDTGAQLLATSLSLAANGHTSYVLSTEYLLTANIRGTIEFDTPSGAQISVLGIRYTPPGTNTTIPSLANIGTGGGLIAHLAFSGGWQTSFVLVNNGSTAASATLNYYADNGTPLTLPLTYLQTGATSSSSSVTQTIQPHASLWLQATGPTGVPLVTGSAQLVTTGNIGGYVVFRYNTNGQEAVVPIETRNANGYIVAFDNTSNIDTGIAISVASPNTQIISAVVRDDQGNLISTGSGFMVLSGNGHSSFDLPKNFPLTAGIRGTIEFDTPAGTSISVIGIRSPPFLTFTSLPPLAK